MRFGRLLGILVAATSLLASVGAAIQWQSAFFPDEDASVPYTAWFSEPEVKALTPGPESSDLSEFMIGSVAIGIFLVESQGHDYDWSDSEVNQTLDGIYSGLDWWASLEPAAHLSFSFELHVRESITYEPIERPIHDDLFWVDEVMTNLGYSDAGVFSKVRHFNGDLRERLMTDWAYAIFVADCSDAVNMGRFTDDEYGWAYYGGPWFTMSRYSSWAHNHEDYNRAVPAHETGHIFYATDEYDSDPVEYSGYLDCPDGNGANGIMNGNTLTLSASTRCQIGWVDIDWDGILDIIEVPPETTIARNGLNPTTDCEARYSGTAAVVPLPNQNHYGPGNDVTVNRVKEVEFRVDGGPWLPVEAEDGTFDEYEESFAFSTPLFSPGLHLVEARAVDTEGNTGASPASDSLVTESQLCSHVNALPPSTDEPILSLSASSMGSVTGVELWYSKDGRNYTLHSIDTEAPWEWSFNVYAAGGDGLFGFYSIAFDANDSRESPPATADASTAVSGIPPEVQAKADANYKPLVALTFAVFLAVAGLWSSKRRPWKGGNGRMAIVKAFSITSLPFILAEAATGVVSLTAGHLSIPPGIGLGTAADSAMLLAGLMVAVLRALKAESSKA